MLSASAANLEPIPSSKEGTSWLAVQLPRLSPLEKQETRVEVPIFFVNWGKPQDFLRKEDPFLSSSFLVAGSDFRLQ